MKTYNFEKLERLLEGDGAKTLNSKETKKGTLFLDALSNGEFAVSFDDINKGIFTDVVKASHYFDQLYSISK